MESPISEITKIWKEIQVNQVLEAVIANVHKESNKIVRADLLVTVSVPAIYDAEYLCHNITSSLSLTSNLFQIVIGTYESIQPSEIVLAKQIQVIVPIYRAHTSEKAIFDKFYIQNHDLQHFCVKLSGNNDTLRVRTALDLITQEFSSPIISNSFIDRTRISSIWSNTRSKAGELTIAAIQPFASCTKRRKEGDRKEVQTQLTQQTASQQLENQPMPSASYYTPGINSQPNPENLGTQAVNRMLPIPVYVQMSN